MGYNADSDFECQESFPKWTTLLQQRIPAALLALSERQSPLRQAFAERLPEELPAGDDWQAEVLDKFQHAKHSPGLPGIAKLAILEDDAGNYAPACHVEVAAEHGPALVAEMQGRGALSDGGDVLGHEDELGFILLTGWLPDLVTDF